MSDLPPNPFPNAGIRRGDTFDTAQLRNALDLPQTQLGTLDPSFGSTPNANQSYRTDPGFAVPGRLIYSPRAAPEPANNPATRRGSLWFADGKQWLPIPTSGSSGGGETGTSEVTDLLVWVSPAGATPAGDDSNDVSDQGSGLWSNGSLVAPTAPVATIERALAIVRNYGYNSTAIIRCTTGEVLMAPVGTTRINFTFGSKGVQSSPLVIEGQFTEGDEFEFDTAESGGPGGAGTHADGLLYAETSASTPFDGTAGGSQGDLVVFDRTLFQPSPPSDVRVMIGRNGPEGNTANSTAVIAGSFDGVASAINDPGTTVNSRVITRDTTIVIDKRMALDGNFQAQIVLRDLNIRVDNALPFNPADLLENVSIFALFNVSLTFHNVSMSNTSVTYPVFFLFANSSITSGQNLQFDFYGTGVDAAGLFIDADPTNTGGETPGIQIQAINTDFALYFSTTRGNVQYTASSGTYTSEGFYSYRWARLSSQNNAAFDIKNARYEEPYPASFNLGGGSVEIGETVMRLNDAAIKMSQTEVFGMNQTVNDGDDYNLELIAFSNSTIDVDNNVLRDMSFDQTGGGTVQITGIDLNGCVGRFGSQSDGQNVVTDIGGVGDSGNVGNTGMRIQNCVFSGSFSVCPASFGGAIRHQNARGLFISNSKVTATGETIEVNNILGNTVASQGVLIENSNVSWGTLSVNTVTGLAGSDVAVFSRSSTTSGDCTIQGLDNTATSIGMDLTQSRHRGRLNGQTDANILGCRLSSDSHISFSGGGTLGPAGGALPAGQCRVGSLPAQVTWAANGANDYDENNPQNCSKTNN